LAIERISDLTISKTINPLHPHHLRSIQRFRGRFDGPGPPLQEAH